ncbi:MAG: phosphoribosylformylglycinamidine synthase subunit PurQ, partial [Lachnospiraceae bacterium]|nr:phosphoribosylformylglycinamidine synthase subunit PurQ [Lachnospiraceae bacterium]
MAWGFDPYLSSISPYHGAMSAVVESIAKVVATGGTYEKCWLTFQEYFERTQNNPDRWGKPMAALLGAYKAQIALGCGSIGGKDSMSGTFEEIDVPPTLVSFAVSVSTSDKVVSQEFKKAGSKVILIKPEYDDNKLINFDSLKAVFSKVEALIAEGKVLSSWAVSYGGVSEAIAKMAFGNRIGFKFTGDISADELYRACYGAFVLELADGTETDERVIGETTDEYTVVSDKYTVDLAELYTKWASKLEPVYPVHVKEPDFKPKKFTYNANIKVAPAIKVAKPRVLIPVFPGTNCEYDTARVFERAGAEADVMVIRNLNMNAIRESVDAMERKIKQAQIIMLPGGFSGGDEPEGSAKFIVSFLRNPKLKDAIHELLQKRDGLMLGICNGFQALIKLGLVPNGKITGQDENSATLTFNTINRHISKMAYTKVVSNKSPWLQLAELDGVYTSPASHGEGRFVAPKDVIEKLFANGQVATRYCDNDGNVSMDEEYNINGSFEAIEGITSPDGRVFGKMAHAERRDRGVAINIYGEQDLKIFESGVKYFK